MSVQQRMPQFVHVFDITPDTETGISTSRTFLYSVEDQLTSTINAVNLINCHICF